MNQHIPLSNIINKLQRKELLLKLEYDYEKETFRQQTEAMGIGRKVKRGMCWYPISAGRSYYNSLNQLVVEVERQEDKDIEHVFEFGRPVCFFTQNASGQLHYFNFTATVNYVDEDRMVIVLPSADALLSIQATERQLGVQLYFDETSYRLMFEALGQVLKAKGNRLAELREIFHGNQKAETFSFGFTRFPWLNNTQEEAVNKVMHAKDVAIVHGPPGTGKTTTLVEAIYETLHREIKSWCVHRAIWLSIGLARNWWTGVFPFSVLVIPPASMTKCLLLPMNAVLKAIPIIRNYGVSEKQYASSTDVRAKERSVRISDRK